MPTWACIPQTNFERDPRRAQPARRESDRDILMTRPAITIALQMAPPRMSIAATVWAPVPESEFAITIRPTARGQRGAGLIGATIEAKLKVAPRSVNPFNQLGILSNSTHDDQRLAR
jgi:hypothetical protein